MEETLIGRFKCDFGSKKICESINLRILVDNQSWNDIFGFKLNFRIFSPHYDEITISTEKPIKFLEDKLEIYSSKYNNNSKNNVHISVSKSEVVFEDLDIYDENGFHLYNAKNVQVSSKEEGNLITYKLLADWTQGFCDSRCKYWRQVERSLPNIFAMW